jgi:cyclohexanone monooxygenase
MIGGPGSPSVLVNVLVANDYQVEWIGKLLEHMRANGLDRIDVDPAAQQHWKQVVNDVIKGTVLVNSKSWYVGANVPGKTVGILAYAGGIANYINECEACADKGYAGFRLSKSGATAAPRASEVPA